jgi:hypothetical protein
MTSLLERLAEMFPDQNYQTKLDQYLSTRGITDAAQLESYIQHFNHNSHKEKLI